MRHDIQFLRGIAVLSVLFYHAEVGPLTNGYLGVDIFFVISGFLITKIILRGLTEETFSFGEFYLRRAKRLLPALYSTLIFTTVLAYLFLTNRQWNDYLDQFIGAITFTSNMVLPLQVGYFEDAAETKPLLHIWSLSLEEQYYFFLPLFLYLSPRRWRLWALITAAALSLAWCLAWTSGPDASPPFLWRFGDSRMSEWAFYLFFTRAWELLAGSLLAWYMLKHPNFSMSKSIKIGAIVGLALLLCFSIDDVHPRGNAMMAVLLTCVMILGQDNWLPKHILTRSVERVGDWSYSLYLIHWPLLAFAQVSFLGDVPGYISATLGGISIVLAYAQYRYVEKHFRYGFQDSKVSAYKFFAGSTLLLFLLPAPIVLSNHNSSLSNSEDFSYLRRVNYGLDKVCDSTYENQWPAACETVQNPVFAVWGDSYAMHLVSGLRANPIVGNSILQITKSACGPILDMAVMNQKYSRAWAEKCISHNNLALENILSHDSVKYVVMSSPFSQYFRDGGQSLLFRGSVIKPDSKIAELQMVKTIQILQNAGKIPIIFSPPPNSGFNIGDCLERYANHALVFGRSDCDFSAEEYRSYQGSIISALKEVQSQTRAHFVWLGSLICEDKMCRTKVENVYLYRDGGHLSHEGSELLLSKLDILQ